MCVCVYYIYMTVRNRQACLLLGYFKLSQGLFDTQAPRRMSDVLQTNKGSNVFETFQ